MNILIIDDHSIVKEGVIVRVKKIIPDANCYFSTNARNAIAELHKTKIDLVLCDLEFKEEPTKDGFFILDYIQNYDYKIKTIALTNYNSYRVMKKAIRLGFNSFLDKSCSFQEFSDTLTQVLKNGNYQSKTMKSILKRKDVFLHNIFSDSLYGVTNLSKRELELTLLLGKTTDNNTLATIMGISVHTVNSHIKNILSKLDLKDRKEIALFSEEFKEEINKYT